MFEEEDFMVKVKFQLEVQGEHRLETYLGEGKVGELTVGVVNGPPDFLRSVVRPLEGGEIKTGGSAKGLIEMELFDRYGNACVAPLRQGEVSVLYYHYHEKRKAGDHK